MKWDVLGSIEQLHAIDELSKERPVLIFKHSTKCGVSKAALDRLEADWAAADDATHKAYFLDLWAHRDVSDAVEKHYRILHESPQVLVIRHGKCIHTTSHRAITYPDTVAALSASTSA